MKELVCIDSFVSDVAQQSLPGKPAQTGKGKGADWLFKTICTF